MKPFPKIDIFIIWECKIIMNIDFLVFRKLFVLLKSFFPLKPRPCMISFLLLRKPGMWKIPYNPIISLFNNLLTHQLILIRLQMINIHPIYNIDIPKLFELVQYMPKRVLIHLEQLIPCIVGCDCDESWGIVRLFVGEPFYYW